MRIIICLLSFFIGASSLAAQEIRYYEEWTYKDLNVRLDSLLDEISRANLSALESLSVYLDSKSSFERQLDYSQSKILLADFTLEALKANTSFIHISLDSNTTSGAFQDYIKTHKDQIFFSEELGKFCDLPLEDRPVKYLLIRPAHYHPSELFQERLKAEFHDDFIFYVENNFRVHKFLRTEENFNQIKDQFDNPYHPIFYKHYSSIFSLKELIAFLKKPEIDTKKAEALRLLEYISQLYLYPSFDYPIINNLDTEKHWPEANTYDYKKIAIKYEYYIDSLKTLEDIHAFAKTHNNSLVSKDADDIEDWFVKFLTEENNKFWKLEAAVYALSSFKNSNALRYGAIMGYNITRHWDQMAAGRHAMMSFLEEMSEFRVAVKNESGDWTVKYEDAVSKENLYLYWYQHYEDYDWDDEKSTFVNTQEAIQSADRFTLLFDDLYHSDHQTAYTAFKQLIEESPVLVERKVDQYNQLREPSVLEKNFAPRRLEFIVNWSTLIDFCKKNQYSYLPEDSLQTTLANYIHASTKEKVQIRKRIALKDITKIEYENNFFQEGKSDSIHVLIKNLYHDHWDELFADDEELLLYFKKSSCGLTQRHFMDEQLAKASLDELLQLKKIYNNTEDLKIKNQILSIFNDNSEKVKQHNLIRFSLDEFLNNLEENFYVIPFVAFEPTDSSYQIIFDKLLYSNREESIVLSRFIKYHLNKNMTPYLIDYAHINTVISRPSCHHHKFEYIYKTTIGDILIGHLETMYNFEFQLSQDCVDYLKEEHVYTSYGRGSKLRRLTRSEWKKFAKENGRHYDLWEEQLYKNALKKIEKPSQFNMRDIKSVLNSKHFQEKTFKLVFKALKTLNTSGELYIIYDSSLAIPKKYLSAFNDPKYNLEDQKMVLHFFSSLTLKELLNYTEKVSMLFGEQEQQELYFSLLRKDIYREELKWLPTKSRKELRVLLQAYKKDIEHNEYTLRELEIVVEKLN